MQPHKIIYYSDELHDDFANTKGAKPIKVTADYKFLKKGPLWRLGSFILYRFIATPLAYLFCRLFYGVRIENRRALQKKSRVDFSFTGTTRSTPATRLYLPLLHSRSVRI